MVSNVLAGLSHVVDGWNTIKNSYFCGFEYVRYYVPLFILQKLDNDQNWRDYFLHGLKLKQAPNCGEGTFSIGRWWVDTVLWHSANSTSGCWFQGWKIGMNLIREVSEICWSRRCTPGAKHTALWQHCSIFSWAMRKASKTCSMTVCLVLYSSSIDLDGGGSMGV